MMNPGGSKASVREPLAELRRIRIGAVCQFKPELLNVKSKLKQCINERSAVQDGASSPSDRHPRHRQDGQGGARDNFAPGAGEELKPRTVEAIRHAFEKT